MKQPVIVPVAPLTWIPAVGARLMTRPSMTNPAVLAISEHGGEVAGAAVRAVDLDQVHGVVGEARAIRVGAGSRLAEPLDFDGVGDVGQGRQHADRVNAGPRDAERDDVQSGVRVGVEERLSERACPGVGRRGDREGRGGKRRGGESDQGNEAETPGLAHGIPLWCGSRIGSRSRAVAT